MHVYLRKTSHVTCVIISEVRAAVLKIREFSSYRLLRNIILCVLCHTSGLKQLCRNPTAASESQHGHTLVVQADPQTYQAPNNPQERASQNDTKSCTEINRYLFYKIITLYIFWLSPHKTRKKLSLGSNLIHSGMSVNLLLAATSPEYLNTLITSSTL